MPVDFVSAVKNLPIPAKLAARDAVVLAVRDEASSLLEAGDLSWEATIEDLPFKIQARATKLANIAEKNDYYTVMFECFYFEDKRYSLIDFCNGDGAGSTTLWGPDGGYLGRFGYTESSNYGWDRSPAAKYRYGKFESQLEGILNQGKPGLEEIAALKVTGDAVPEAVKERASWGDAVVYALDTGLYAIEAFDDGSKRERNIKLYDTAGTYLGRTSEWKSTTPAPDTIEVGFNDSAFEN